MSSTQRCRPSCLPMAFVTSSAIADQRLPSPNAPQYPTGALPRKCRCGALAERALGPALVGSLGRLTLRTGSPGCPATARRGGLVPSPEHPAADPSAQRAGDSNVTGPPDGQMATRTGPE